mgnify:CR=1 FL=1
MRRLLITVLCLLCATPAFAATTYYKQSTSGTGDGSSCANAAAVTSLSGGSFTSADTAVLCSGTFTTGIDLDADHAGMTIRVDSGAAVVIDTSSTDDGITYASGAVGITLRGDYGEGSLLFKDPGGRWIWLQSGANENIFDGITCLNTDGYTGGNYEGFSVDSNLNIIKNSSFGRDCAAGAGSDAIWVEGDSNLFIGNTFGKAPHYCLNFRGTSNHNVVYNNTFENTLHASTGSAVGADHNVFTKNMIKNNGTLCDSTTCSANSCGSATDQASDSYEHRAFQFNGGRYCRIRYNTIYNDGNHGSISMTVYENYGEDTDYNRMYNNTVAELCAPLILFDEVGSTTKVTNNGFLNNIFGASSGEWCTNSYEQANLYVQDGTNWITNNIFYGAANTIRYRSSTNISVATLDSTYSECSGNIATDPSLDGSYQIGSGSSAVDTGAPHATTVGTGSSSTSLVVSDPYMFFTKGSPWNITASEISSDTIYVAAATPFTATITAINESTATLTLDSAHTWESGVDVYFLLDGEMWSGDEIDIGAYEYDSGTPSSSGRRRGVAGMMMGW